MTDKRNDSRMDELAKSFESWREEVQKDFQLMKEEKKLEMEAIWEKTQQALEKSQSEMRELKEFVKVLALGKKSRGSSNLPDPNQEEGSLPHDKGKKAWSSDDREEMSRQKKESDGRPEHGNREETLREPRGPSSDPLVKQIQQFVERRGWRAREGRRHGMIDINGGMIGMNGDFRTMGMIGKGVLTEIRDSTIHPMDSRVWENIGGIIGQEGWRCQYLPGWLDLPSREILCCWKIY